jgi:C1A family cysteine protease
LILEVTTELVHPDADGEIAIPPITAAIGDYHSMLVVGVATEQRRSRRRLLLRNTWGALWGLGGYAWLPLAYLVTFAVDASVIDTTSLSP